MRIKQSKLTGKKPVKYYVRQINGVHAIVCVYDNPRCINTIVTDKNGKETRQCYPLTEQQYNVYVAGSVAEQNKLIAKGGKIYGTNKIYGTK